MEGDAPAKAKGKRKAEAASPTREHHDQSTLIATDGDRKRLNLSCQDDPVTATSVHSNLATPGEINHPNENSDHSNDNDEDDENDDDENDDDESDEDEDDSGCSQNALSIGEDDEESDEMDEFRNDDFGTGWDEEEDMGPPELEVEEMEHFIGESHKTKVVFKTFLQDNDDEFEEWMKTIHVECSYDEKCIGHGFGRYVRRDRIRSHFWRDMEEPCHELSEIAFEVFDRYGCLKEDLKSHPVRKGSGVWGSELDLGSFFVVEQVYFEKDWRLKGLGKQLVHFLMTKAQAEMRNPLFTLVIPGWLARDIRKDIDGKTKKEEQEIRGHAINGAKAFYRSLGFRRIGASYCFGLAADPDHPAHALPSSADFDPQEEEADTDEPPEGYEGAFEDGFKDPAKISWRLKLLEERLPLHHAAITLPDNECVQFFRDFKSSEKPVGVWAKVDRFSKNILHIAASEMKVQSVRWLLSNVDDDQKLSSARNVQGYTPLEELESQLETKRNTMEYGLMTVVISDKFPGYSAEAIGCLAALRKIKSPSAIQCLQLKYGCTCGECIAGFLSPRMKSALLCKAEESHDILNEDVSDGISWCMSNFLIDHVAPDIQRNFRTNKSLRQGYSNIFDHAAITLRGNKAPTINNVLKTWRDSGEWPPVTRNFYQRGGNAESALRVMFEHARDQDEYAGDGGYMMFLENYIKDLPKCRNDHEFGFVALACGISELDAVEFASFHGLSV